MILKVISANSVDPDQEQSDLSPHCLPVCKNRFEKFARIFSRRQKQTTFSDAVFLGALRVKTTHKICYDSKMRKLSSETSLFLVLYLCKYVIKYLFAYGIVVRIITTTWQLLEIGCCLLQ